MNMTIDRHNYEEFFLLYVDNELSPAERKAVEDFVAENTDLQSELDLMKDAVLHPEPALSFDFKASLMKSEDDSGLITNENCQTYFLLYADNELDAGQKLQVEKFVFNHPQHQANFELLRQVKMIADTSIVFPDKASLYRKEKDDKVVPIIWWRMMAAAVVLLAVGIASWYLVTNNNNGSGQPPVMAEKNTPKTSPSTTVTEPLKPVTDQSSSALGRDVAASDPVSSEPANRANASSLARGVQQVAVKTNVSQEKNAPNSNIHNPSSVTPIQEDVVIKNPPVTIQKPVEEIAKPNPTETVASLVSSASTTEQAGYQEYVEQGSSDVVFVANTSVNKKSKLRGVFRKASRFIEKATNLDPGSRGIRVANVEIGLK